MYPHQNPTIDLGLQKTVILPESPKGAYSCLCGGWVHLPKAQQAGAYCHNIQPQHTSLSLKKAHDTQVTDTQTHLSKKRETCIPEDNMELAQHRKWTLVFQNPVELCAA